MDAHTVVTDDGVALHVGVAGRGPDVAVLSGGPGCVHYLASDDLVPDGFRLWFPEARGVGRSLGGPHDMARAVADLEDVRRAAGVDRWLVVGHSWGSDLAVRYALNHPEVVRGVVGVAGHGIHKDRSWSATYEAGKATEVQLDIAMNVAVWRALQDSFVDWIHEPDLLRSLADSSVPMSFFAAARDIRPDWPLRQLATLVPRGRFRSISNVPHDFWATHPTTWTDTIQRACREMSD